MDLASQISLVMSQIDYTTRYDCERDDEEGDPLASAVKSAAYQYRLEHSTSFEHHLSNDALLAIVTALTQACNPDTDKVAILSWPLLFSCLPERLRQCTTLFDAVQPSGCSASHYKAYDWRSPLQLEESTHGAYTFIIFDTLELGLEFSGGGGAIRGLAAHSLTARLLSEMTTPAELELMHAAYQCYPPTKLVVAESSLSHEPWAWNLPKECKQISARVLCCIPEDMELIRRGWQLLGATPCAYQPSLWRFTTSWESFVLCSNFADEALDCVNEDYCSDALERRGRDWLNSHCLLACYSLMAQDTGGWDKLLPTDLEGTLDLSKLSLWFFFHGDCDISNISPFEQFLRQKCAEAGGIPMRMRHEWTNYILRTQGYSFWLGWGSPAVGNIDAMRQCWSGFDGMSQLINRCTSTFVHPWSSKDGLARMMREYKAVHPECNIAFMPKTYLTDEPNDCVELRDIIEGDGGADKLFIYKPIGKCQGRGIQVMNGASISDWVRAGGSDTKGLFQHYVTNPLLIEGRKFDLRVYVAIITLEPFTAMWWPKHVMIRRATNPYSTEDLSDKFCHLTNAAVQGGDGDVDDTEFIWTLSKLQQYFDVHGIAEPDYTSVQLPQQIEEVLSHCLRAARMQIRKGLGTMGKWQLFGVDILVSSDLELWFLEANSSPQLAMKKSKTPSFQGIKQEMKTDATSMAMEVHSKQKARRLECPSCVLAPEDILPLQSCKHAKAIVLD